MNFMAYKLSETQNMLQMLNQCEAEGVTDVRFVRQRLHDHISAEMVKKEREYRKTVPRTQRLAQRAGLADKTITICSSCGSAAVVEKVNISPATMIGDGLRSAIVCINPGCRHTEYSSMSTLEILNRGGQ